MNYLYDTTTIDLPPSGGTFRLSTWPNVRMETEIALGLSKAPEPGMGDDDLLPCIDWAALDFEICTSIFPSWRFKVADAAATGVHLALLLGEGRSIGGRYRTRGSELVRFSATLAEAAGMRAARRCTGSGAAHSRLSDMLYGCLRDSAESRFAPENS